ncbi:AraC family transcriptional regulator [Janthinobacterium sp. MDT1-19]|uniref:AraC family transcriptional regulator n=1 Tax=Janthinobacterium sp. MDT1-19 TaxID=1259339 RepID=UPI003F25280F
MDNQINEQMGRLRTLAAQNKNGRLETGIPRVAMVQGAIPEHELATVYEPMINLILQGSKSMTVGEQTFDYDPATYFVMSVELPAVGVIRSNAAGEPYMAVALTLVPSILAELIADLPPGCAENRGNAFSVAAVTPELLDAWTRMLGLMVRPDDIAALAPAYEREILYRVLQGPHGAMLRAIATPDSAMARLAAAIAWIRRDFNLPMRVEELAGNAAMSVSAFHRHFKAATSLSPVQYQKRIRLMHARTLMVAKGSSVAAAAYDVGYESATQFSREYARLFGMAPRRDTARMLAHTRNA